MWLNLKSPSRCQHAFVESFINSSDRTVAAFHPKTTTKKPLAKMHHYWLTSVGIPPTDVRLESLPQQDRVGFYPVLMSLTSSVDSFLSVRSKISNSRNSTKIIESGIKVLLSVSLPSAWFESKWSHLLGRPVDPPPPPPPPQCTPPDAQTQPALSDRQIDVMPNQPA